LIGQGQVNRPVEETLARAWSLLSRLPAARLKRIPEEYLALYHPDFAGTEQRQG
jgi:vacuolar-type H+-ATPase subunit B/Vma2